MEPFETRSTQRPPSFDLAKCLDLISTRERRNHGIFLAYVPLPKPILTVLLVEHLERFDKLVCDALDDSHLGLGFLLEVPQVEWHVLILLLDLRALEINFLSGCHVDWGNKKVFSFGVEVPSALIIFTTHWSVLCRLSAGSFYAKTYTPCVEITQPQADLMKTPLK